MGHQVGGEMTKKVCGRLKVYVVGKHSEVRKEAIVRDLASRNTVTLEEKRVIVTDARRTMKFDLCR